MSPLNRRGFMKASLATVVGGSKLASISLGRLAPTQAAAETKSTLLEAGDQQLRLSDEGGLLSFQNFLRSSTGWKPSTLADNPVVTGPSFRLLAPQVTRQNNALMCKGAGTADALDGKPLKYSWDLEIGAHQVTPQAPWFRFQTTLHLPAAVRLSHASRPEPQVIVWLNSISMLMEGQAGSWRRVVLQQPTRNSLAAWGNDLPALYYLDQNAGVETMMYFDMSDMGWMSMDNLPRFLVYRCSNTSTIRRDGTQQLGVGLVADEAVGDIMPAGDIRFTYWFLQRPMTTLLNEQQAVARWMEALLPLFEEKLTWPRCAGNWKDFAAGTVRDLQDSVNAQVEVGGHTGLRAYVKGTSQIWKQPANSFELMTVADVLWPSLLYLRLHPSPPYEQLCGRLLASLPSFYRADTHSISNSFRKEENERADSWYPFENALIKYPMIGSIAGSKEIAKYFLDALGTATTMAQEYDYLFPIYYRVANLQAEGAGTNYAIGGLYAWACQIAHRITGDPHYSEEARRAIQALWVAPAERLFHEPQELAYGALAAADLKLKDQTDYLLYQQLRMFYWYSDPSQQHHDIRGMAQAAASILYPAFKENVEAILPWTGIMKRGTVHEGMLRFMDQQRRNNFSFFEACSTGARTGSLAYVPFENLGTLELGGQTGNVGKEIYGAGECLWMYLMFEALGQVSDRELMLVNLDLMDVFEGNSFPPRQLNFILYNPTSAERTARILIPPAQGHQVRLTEQGKEIAETVRVPAHGSMRLAAEY